MTVTDETFFRLDSKRGRCADATGAPSMAAPDLSDLLAALREMETDAPDCLRGIGQAWGKRVAERFARLLAERTGRPATLAQAPLEAFLALCRDYLGAHGFGQCAFVESEPTLAIHIQGGQPGASPMLAGFFEALIAGVINAPVLCRMQAPEPERVILQVFQGEN